MRIACIHIPQYALQCATRIDPSLRGAAVAMVAGGDGGSRTGPLHAPIVVACSRAAWALGVRLGMTAAGARNLGSPGRPGGAPPELSVVPVEPQLERETVRGLAESLLAVTGVVDVGGRVGAGGAHLALYAEVPAKTRGNAFGERVLARLAELGLTGRVGIADDRFTAWVAAAYPKGAASPRMGDHAATSADADGGKPQDDVITVPRGGSAAFLSPRPLSLLAIAPEVQHMLEALGVGTLGEFAALPAPSIARPLEADYQALARGDSGSRLRPYVPEAAIREEVVVRAGNVLDADGAIGGPTAIGLVAQRIALRLEGRGRGAVKLELAVIGADHTQERALELPAPIASAEELARVLSPAAGWSSHGDGTAAPWRLRVVVTGEAAPHETMAASSETVARAGAPLALSLALPVAASADPIAMVLSTPGSLFALSAPEAGGRLGLPREHRRMRRGKQRRVRPGAVAQLAGPSLFDRTGG